MKQSEPANRVHCDEPHDSHQVGREENGEARRMEEIPMPAVERRRVDLRPILSGRGAHSVVMMRLRAEIATERMAAEVGRREVRRWTEYMIMLLMPVNCWVSITMITEMMPGKWLGFRMARKMLREDLSAEGALWDAGREGEDDRRSDSSSAG